MRVGAPLLAALVLYGGVPVRAGTPEARYYAEGRYQVREHSGTIAGDATRVRLETDLGAVHIHTAPGNEVTYRVRVRTRGDDAGEARRRLDRMVISASRTGDLLLFTGSVPRQGQDRLGLTADFDIAVPSQVSVVEVVSGAGDIEAAGTPGSAMLSTRGGTITASDIGGRLEAETRGGDVRVGKVRTEARLNSAGGNVSIESSGGGLAVRTSGGDVRIGRTGGDLSVETGGGNVQIETAGGSVRVATSGGSIEVGDAAGEVTAGSAGGGIKIGRAKGGVHCETAAGSIVLDSVSGPIRALTSAGSIRALLGSMGLGQPGDSDLRTQQGDIIVSLPESLAFTIRALIDNPEGQGIESDFPLTIVRDLEEPGRALEIGEGSNAGGGPMLKIRTLGGRIQILKVKNSKPAQQ